MNASEHGEEHGNMDSAEDNQSIADEKEVDELEGAECEEAPKVSKKGLVKNLKELPSVHKSKKKLQRISHPVLSLSLNKNTFNEANLLDPMWWKNHLRDHRVHQIRALLTEHASDHYGWTIGGSVGSRTALLRFQCCALSNPPVDPPANQLHMTYKTVNAETKLLAAVLNCHGFREVHPNVPDYNILWTGVHPRPHMLKNMTAYQRVNHFPRSYELTRKDRLFKNIEKMQHCKGAKHFDFIPQTFVMPTDFRELCSTHYRHKGPWIVKPVASSRGRGIYIVNSPDQVPLDETLVVAKYIDNPLLVDGHKCDLRLYVAVTSYDPLVVYMYEEGLVRFATVKYDSSGKHLWNPCMHLCNYSINKYHSDYIMNEDPDAENVGHKWTLSALLRHLRAQNIDTAMLMSRIEEVVVKAILASAPPIIAACRMFVPHIHNCFELYGFDILIDSTLKPWLLEVNLSPSLGCDSPLDVRVKSAMLVDLLTLIGLPAVDPMLRRVGELRRNHYHPIGDRRCRRVQSADMLANPARKLPPGTSSRLASSSLTLSAEETRMVKYARSEFDRRGGFIRIFPSSESWKRYSSFLDPATGMTVTANSNFGQYPLVAVHNFNLTLHQQLFPELTSDGSVSHYNTANNRLPSPDRLTRYERALLQGHKASLDTGSDKMDSDNCAVDIRDVELLLKEIITRLERGERLSQYQARRMFGQYLICILRRVSKSGVKPEDDGTETILHFLRKASSNLRTPYIIQLPTRKMNGKDRTAMVAKQLNDFIYLYNRETELYTDSMESTDQLSNRIFVEFLAVARECDLEEVLTVHTRVNKCAHLYLGRCGVSSSQSSLGLLRTLPPLGGPKEECAARRSCVLRTQSSKALPPATSLHRTSLPAATSPTKKIVTKASRQL